MLNDAEKLYLSGKANMYTASCNAALSAAPVKAFSSSGTTTTLQNIGPDKANPDFDLFCEQ